MKEWRQHIEANTGEVSTKVISDALDIPEGTVREYAEIHHGARFVGGTSEWLIWKEDAEEIEKLKRAIGDDTCSGYTNKETYDIGVWFQHNQRRYAAAQEAAREALKRVAPRSHLGHWLEDYIREGKPLDNGDIYYQLLNSALARVNWCEVADGFLEE